MLWCVQQAVVEEFFSGQRDAPKQGTTDFLSQERCFCLETLFWSRR